MCQTFIPVQTHIRFQTHAPEILTHTGAPTPPKHGPEITELCESSSLCIKEETGRRGEGGHSQYYCKEKGGGGLCVYKLSLRTLRGFAAPRLLLLSAAVGSEVGGGGPACASTFSHCPRRRLRSPRCRRCPPAPRPPPPCRGCPTEGDCPAWPWLRGPPAEDRGLTLHTIIHVAGETAASRRPCFTFSGLIWSSPR